MFERYMATTQGAVNAAYAAAQRRRAKEIDPMHLLLGILSANDLAPLLTDQPVWPDTLRTAVLAKLPPATVATPLPFDPAISLNLSHETKRILAYGAEEGERLGHPHISNGHLLLGILREQKCQAALLLVHHGITAAWLRQRLKS